MTGNEDLISFLVKYYDITNEVKLRIATYFIRTNTNNDCVHLLIPYEKIFELAIMYRNKQIYNSALLNLTVVKKHTGLLVSCNSKMYFYKHLSTTDKIYTKLLSIMYTK